jgi:hypothetical protein
VYVRGDHWVRVASNGDYTGVVRRQLDEVISFHYLQTRPQSLCPCQ